MYPYDFSKGQLIATDCPDISTDRAFLAHLHWTAAEAAVADVDGAVDGEAASASTVVTVLAAAMLAQPPCPRNAVIEVKASTAGHVKAAAIRVNGLNMKGEAIYEELTPTVDTPAVLTGAKIFASFTSLVIPAQDGASVTIDLGWGELCGLPYLLTHDTVLKTFNDNVADTAPVVAHSATAIESNSIDFNGSLDGSVMDVYLMV